MQQQRERDTGPERRLRSELHYRGVRFRLQRQIVTGTRRAIDIVFPAARVAVDVRGCFWHGHEHDAEEYGHTRTKNLDYWSPKVARNRARDHDTQARLTEAGWHVVVVWACDDLGRAADEIARIVRDRRQ